MGICESCENAVEEIKEITFCEPAPLRAGGFGSFEPLTQETKSLYDQYTSLIPEAVTSPIYFQSLYAWNFISVNRYKILGEFLCFVANDTTADETFAYPPLGAMGEPGELGEKSFASAVLAVMGEFEREGLECEFRDVPEFMLPFFSGIEGYKADVSYDRNWSEYIYTRDDYAEGIDQGKFRWGKRDFIRKFKPSSREMTPADRDVVRAITQNFFCPERDCPSCFCGCELEVVTRIMDNWDGLGMKGVLVESEGEALAFGIVCYQKDTAYCISKKLKRRTRGLDSYLTSVMLESLFDTKYKYMNYSDDLGNDGLREYKSTLARHDLMHRYVVRLQKT